MMNKNVKIFMEKLKKMDDFHNVKFIFLYGSRAIGKATKMSDYDFAVYYNGDKKERFNFLVKASFSNKFDVKIFQDLPLFVRKEVLKGKLIYENDRIFVFDIAYKTIKDFDYFKKYYYDYIGLEKIR